MGFETVICLRLPSNVDAFQKEVTALKRRITEVRKIKPKIGIPLSLPEDKIRETVSAMAEREVKSAKISVEHFFEKIFFTDNTISQFAITLIASKMPQTIIADFGCLIIKSFKEPIKNSANEITDNTDGNILIKALRLAIDNFLIKAFAFSGESYSSFDS